MRRRDFLAMFAASTVPVRVPAQRTTGRLKITDIRLVNLRTIREAGSIEPAWNPGTQTRFTVGGGSIIEIHTDQGLKGIGPGIDEGLLAAVKSQLVGKDPVYTEDHAVRLRY